MPVIPLPDTVPVENLLPLDEYSKEYSAFFRSFGYPRDLVKIHQEKLGKQTKTFRGEYRMWVWSRPSWTVFVSNIKGICFEVPVDTSLESAWAAWREYKKAMGCT